MPRRRLKRLSPWILAALVLLLALSLSIDALRRDPGVDVASPPAPNSSKAAASSLKTIAAPLTAAEQRAVKAPAARSGDAGAGLKEIPAARGRLQRTRFGQDGDLVKMVPQEKIVAEPLAALGPDVRRSRAGNPDPNSVFSWGPWSQTTSLARVDGLAEQDAAPQQGFVRTAIVTQARQDTAVSRPASEGLSPPVGNPPTAFTPPVVVTPPLAGGTKPGHGFGDRNHTHQHRRGSGR